MDDLIKKAAEDLSAAKNVTALTGAGISIESGIPPFRGKGGLWERFDPMEYAHIDAFMQNPTKVWSILFKEMKETSFLINIGRGDVINEKDLIKALKKGWIAGAGLDVFETEPLPDSSPLWEMDNVILTPHVSGFTPYYDDRAVDLFITNLHRYLDGDPLLNLINREQRY